MNLDRLRESAFECGYVAGLTHNFYRYPARFSPQFAAAAIECLSRPGDLVLDPFMGGGTAVVEAVASGRRAIGSDLNALSVFVARVKTTTLSDRDHAAVARWRRKLSHCLHYRYPRDLLRRYADDPRSRNLGTPEFRAVRKGIAIASQLADNLRGKIRRDFAKCVVLRASQKALDSRRRPMSLGDFRETLCSTAVEMESSIRDYKSIVDSNDVGSAVLLTTDARTIHLSDPFADGERAKLVIMSPPYPGVHVVYHRWQVDGRRETPAPYWITNCRDGSGASYYTFGDRRRPDTYFRTAEEALASVRQVLSPRGHLVQLLAFTDPRNQLRRYLRILARTGFEEVHVRTASKRRVWRDVPNRRWYANMKGRTYSSREVVLVHRVR